MPTYTLAQQRALTLRRLRVGNTSRFSPSGGTADYDWIDDAIQQGEEEFVRMTKCLKTYAIIQLKSGVRTYRAPSDMIDIAAAYYYDSALTEGYVKLRWLTTEKLNDDVSDWLTDTGTPEAIYMDRKRGDYETIGVYPAPDTDGSAISFTNTYADEVTWICPLYTNRWDFGRIMRYAGTDTFVLSTNTTVIVPPEVSNYNILLEYYRMPYQRSEMPVESAKCVSMYAAASLLSDNPEDSAEYKRAIAYKQLFEEEVAKYINRRKRPVAATELRIIPAVWNWQKSMPYYEELA